MSTIDSATPRRLQAGDHSRWNAGPAVGPCYHQFLVSRELGGAGLIGLHLAAFLSEHGHATRLWVPGDGPARDEAERLGLAIEKYNPTNAYSPRKVKAGLVNLKLALRLRRYGPGIAHFHSPGHYGALWRGLSFSGQMSVAQVQIEEDPATLRWAFRHPPDLIITCARFLVDYVRRHLLPELQEKQRIVPVPNAVDTSRFYPGDKSAAKLKVGAPLNEPLILMLANLAPHKGQVTAIEAVAALKQRGVKVTCWLAGLERGGEGAYTTDLRALIARLGVEDRVCLLGFRKDTADLLRAADFFLLPSTCEGLPLSILEAQATKVPVLAAPTAGIPEAVAHYSTGFLIPATEPIGYANCIAELLDNANLYHAVTEQALARVKREYSWSTFCQRIWGHYQQLCPAMSRSCLGLRDVS